MTVSDSIIFFFFFNDTATTEIYTLSLHDALPISVHRDGHVEVEKAFYHVPPEYLRQDVWVHVIERSEEHTSELQSRLHLVCRLLLEKKKNQIQNSGYHIHPHTKYSQRSSTSQGGP